MTVYRLLIILSLVLAPFVSADEEISNAQEAKRLLEGLRQQIAALQANLHERKSQVDVLVTEISRAEETLKQAQIDQSRYQSQIDDKRQQLLVLEEQRRQAGTAFELYRDSYQQAVRAMFVLVRETKLKQLLAQNNPVTASRRLTYYDYLRNAVQKKLDGIAARFVELDGLQNAITLERDKLTELEDAAAAHRSEIEGLKQAHSASLVALRNRISDDQGQLSQLLKDEEKLSRLLRDIQAENARQDRTGTVSLGALKGSLPWPTEGRLVLVPGSTLRTGGAKWSGVLIEASPGSTVKAISSGWVVFADWFRNLGLLLIIDHGHGYMSLYGNNNDLYKAPGEWVAAGDTIATVGTANNRGDSNSLYFEIRHNGEALDPRDWCTK